MIKSTSDTTDPPCSPSPRAEAGPTHPTLIDIWALAAALLLGAGLVLLGAGLSTLPHETGFDRITEQVIDPAPERFGAQGYLLRLPSPPDTAVRLASQGWDIDTPDNSRQPDACRHRLMVNGILLDRPHEVHQTIGDAGGGRYSIWGESLESAVVYFSLPVGHDRLESLAIEWAMARYENHPVCSSPTSCVIAGTILTLVGSGLVWSLRPGTSRRLSSTPIFLVAGAGWGAVITLSSLATKWEPSGTWCQGALLLAVQGVLWSVVLLALLLAFAPRRTRGFLERSVERGFAFGTFAIIGCILSGTLSAYWVAATPVWQSWSMQGVGSTLFAGRIPLSDAAGWYAGSAAVLSGEEVTWAARRPMHPLIRAGSLVMSGGNFQASLLVVAVLSSLAITALVETIRRQFSAACGLLALVGASSLGAAFVGSYLSESVAFACACLGLSCAITGQSDRRFGMRLAGTWWLALAWMVRPGPFGLLPIPLITEACLSGPRRMIRFAAIAAVLFLTLLSGRAAFSLIASNHAVPNANAASTVYGLTIDRDWGAAYQNFFDRDPTRKDLPLAQQTQIMYEEAWANFQADPAATARALWRGLRDGAQASVIGSVESLWIRPLFGKPVRVFSILVVILTVIGTVTAIRAGSTGVIALLASWWIGLVLSLPIIWTDGTVRGITIAMPAVVVSYSLMFARRQSDGSRKDPCANPAWRVSALAGASLVTCLAMGVVVFVVRRDGQPSQLPYIAHLDQDPCVFIVEQDGAPRVWGPPALLRDDVVQFWKDLGIPNGVYGFDELIHKEPAPFLLISAGRGDSVPVFLIPGAEYQTTGTIVIEELAPSNSAYWQRATRWHWRTE